MSRLGAFAGVVFASLISCTIGGVDSPSATPSVDVAWRAVAEEAIPWTLEAPEGWFVTTERSAPNPNLRVGVLQAWIGTAKYRKSWRLGPGPNSGAGASAKLGPDAVMVHVQLLYGPPDCPIRWVPDAGTELGLRRDWGSHADAQNPGWTFHERHLCQGPQCVSVLKRPGPRRPCGRLTRLSGTLG
jgi:hypothetical protein